MSDAPESEYRLKPRFTIEDCPGEVFSIRWSQDGNYLAAGCGDGTIRVFTVAEKEAHLKYNLNVGPKDGLPMTAMRFRPVSERSKTQNVLLAVNADGTAQHWHITSGRRMHRIVDEDNQLYCVDYTEDGSRFVCAGKDYSVKVYDEGTKMLTADMRGGFGSASPGHSNRVFSAKFVPEDENLVVSGGWDNTVQIWDTRTEHAVRSFYGPHICGDSLDVKNGQIVTGCVWGCWPLAEAVACFRFCCNRCSRRRCCCCNRCCCCCCNRCAAALLQPLRCC
jgi:COMPASS component SWD3